MSNSERSYEVTWRKPGVGGTYHVRAYSEAEAVAKFMQQYPGYEIVRIRLG